MSTSNPVTVTRSLAWTAETLADPAACLSRLSTGTPRQGHQAATPRPDGRPESVGRTLVRVVRILRAVPDLGERRTGGRLWHRGLAKLPAVGVVGGFLAERHAFDHVALAAADAFEAGGTATAP